MNATNDQARAAVDKLEAAVHVFHDQDSVRLDREDMQAIVALRNWARERLTVSVPSSAENDSAKVSLSSPTFDEEVRGAIDGLILANRSAAHIYTWLHTIGLNVETGELIKYMGERREALEELSRDPMLLLSEQVSQHVRGLRAKAIYIWSKLTDEQRCTVEMYIGVQKEIDAALELDDVTCEVK